MLALLLIFCSALVEFQARGETLDRQQCLELIQKKEKKAQGTDGMEIKISDTEADMLPEECRSLKVDGSQPVNRTEEFQYSKRRGGHMPE